MIIEKFLIVKALGLHTPSKNSMCESVQNPRCVPKIIEQSIHFSIQA